MGTEEISFGGEGGSVEPEPTVYPVYIVNLTITFKL